MNFEKLETYLDTLKEKMVPACDMVVYHDHTPVFRHMAGYRDAGNTVPLAGNETYCLYSCTKVFTTCAVMQLAERGLLNLDDPVSMYLPAYGSLKVNTENGTVPTQRTLTIRHLMSMQSGLDYDLDTPGIREVLERTHHMATTREIADALARKPLNFEPGSAFLYSLSHDVLGAVIEVVSGKRFGEYLQENIFDPLRMPTIGFDLKEKDKERQCAQYEYLEDEAAIKSIPAAYIEHRLSPLHESGGAGLISDVQDYITFADALACGGTGENGARILEPETISSWSANQLVGRSRRTFDESFIRPGYSYALGVRTRVDLTKGGSGSIGEFGWDGAAGSWVMIDPHRHLSAFYAMHIKNFGYSYDVIHPILRSLVYEGFDAE